MRFNFQFDSVRGYDLAINGGFAAALVLGLCGAYFGIYCPIHAETARLQASSQELQQLIDNTSHISQTKKELEDDLAAKRAAAEKLLERIPTAARESDFLAQVCQLAHANEMEVADYHPGAVHELENHHEMEVKISARGEFSALCRFLRQADDMPRLCRLVHMDVGSTLDSERLEATLTYRIYFAPQTTPALANKDGSP
jgi:Tfp pilus assembly protein PilO